MIMKPNGLRLLLLLLASQDRVHADVTPCHRIVANLAWKLLSNATQHTITSILEQNAESYTWQIIEICGDNEEPWT